LSDLSFFIKIEYTFNGFIPKVNVNKDNPLRIISGGGKLFLVEELTGGFGSSLPVLGITGNLPRVGFYCEFSPL